MPQTKPDLVVLAVDDDSALRQHLAEALPLLGCRVLTASDGVEAMTILDAQRVDLLITDYDMPRMNGLELIQWATGRLPRLTAVLMTGQSSPSVAAAAQECGARHVLLKPVSVQHLLSLLEQVREMPSQ